MTDTQWPRFIVFHQEKAGVPHQYSGSVHAPDAELALLNARDVFVRRPNCVSLWIVPAAAIFSQTAEERARYTLTLHPPLPHGEGEKCAQLGKFYSEVDLPPESYCVFQKMTPKGTHLYQGEVQAPTAESALQQAFERDLADAKATVWWVFPARWITCSTPQDTEVFFAPALSKTYRDQGVFHTEAIMQKLKSRSQADDEG